MVVYYKSTFRPFATDPITQYDVALLSCHSAKVKSELV